MDWGEGRRLVRTFIKTSKSVSGSCSGNSDNHYFSTRLMLISLLLLAMQRSTDSYVGAGVTVADTVVAVGTPRYELQNVVAGPPSAFKTPKTPVTTAQLTARGASGAPVARAAQEAGASWGAQLTSATATEKSENKSVLNSIIAK